MFHRLFDCLTYCATTAGLAITGSMWRRVLTIKPIVLYTTVIATTAETRDPWREVRRRPLFMIWLWAGRLSGDTNFPQGIHEAGRDTAAAACLALHAVAPAVEETH
jgi:hypothetical protein